MQILTLLTSFVLANAVVGSPGDQLDEFIDCICACEYDRKCAGSGINYIDPNTNEFHDVNFVSMIDGRKTFLSSMVSKATFWDCMSECDYECQQIITYDRIRKNKKILQFHGKWPFKKIMGFQEFFASIFSIGNFIPQYRGYKLIQKRLERNSKRAVTDVFYEMMLRNYMWVSIMGMLAWTSSTVFHLRDLVVTEKFDYFFAGGTVLSGFHAILTRLIYKHVAEERRYRYMKIVSGLVVTIFTCHILRLYIDWSYRYNMKFNIFFGVLQYIVLIYVGIDNYIEIQRVRNGSKTEDKSKLQASVFKLSYLPILLVLFTSMSMSLELYDRFSIKWQLDSHATWHLLTIVPSWYLFDFFLADLDFALHRRNE